MDEPYTSRDIKNTGKIGPLHGICMENVPLPQSSLNYFLAAPWMISKCSLKNLLAQKLELIRTETYFHIRSGHIKNENQSNV